MQPLVALSTTEAEYIALSSALREVIAIMNLLTELRANGFPALHAMPHVICRVFEDNKSCLEIATNHKSRPRTKHLSVRLHHFHSYVKAKLIHIEHVSTKDQIVDIFTKPLPRPQFRVLRDQLMGWPSYPGGNGKVTFLLGFGTQRRVTWRLAGATLVTWHALPSVKKSALELKKVLEA